VQPEEYLLVVTRTETRAVSACDWRSHEKDKVVKLKRNCNQEEEHCEEREREREKVNRVSSTEP